jgi:hypothetical protein
MARTRSIRYARRPFDVCDQHSMYHRPWRTTTAHGSTSASHSEPASERYLRRTRRWPEQARTTAAVASGSGRAAARSGAGAVARRTASAWAATGSGSARTILPSALPTGLAGSLASWWPSSTAMTRPSASVALNISGGSRRPRPT